MMTSAKPVCFVASARPAEARAFYEGVLGLRLKEDNPYALVFDAGGTTLRIQKVGDARPSGYTDLGWEVGDVHAAVAALEKRGVSFERYEGMSQDASGVWTAPGGAMVAWFKDPDGHTLSLTQHPRRTGRSAARRKPAGARRGRAGGRTAR